MNLIAQYGLHELVLLLGLGLGLILYCRVWFPFYVCARPLPLTCLQLTAVPQGLHTPT